MSLNSTWPFCNDGGPAVGHQFALDNQDERAITIGLAVGQFERPSSEKNPNLQDEGMVVDGCTLSCAGEAKRRFQV